MSIPGYFLHNRLGRVLAGDLKLSHTLPEAQVPGTQTSVGVLRGKIMGPRACKGASRLEENEKRNAYNKVGEVGKTRSYRVS